MTPEGKAGFLTGREAAALLGRAPEGINMVLHHLGVAGLSFEALYQGKKVRQVLYPREGVERVKEKAGHPPAPPVPPDPLASLSEEAREALARAEALARKAEGEAGNGASPASPAPASRPPGQPHPRPRKAAGAKKKIGRKESRRAGWMDKALGAPPAGGVPVASAIAAASVLAAVTLGAKAKVQTQARPSRACRHPVIVVRVVKGTERHICGRCGHPFRSEAEAARAQTIEVPDP